MHYPNMARRRRVPILLSIALALILSMVLLLPARMALASLIIVNPGESIQAAIDGATAGDTIQINPGTYTESIVLAKAVNLLGTDRATTIIQAPANSRVLQVDGAVVSSAISISGLTFSGGSLPTGGTPNCNTDCGAGIYIINGAQPDLADLIVEDNEATQGAGIYSETDLTIRTSIIRDNSTGNDGGAGIYVDANAYVYNSTLRNNQAGDGSGGGLYVTGDLDTSDMWLDKNGAGDGGGAYIQGSTFMTRGLLTDNTAFDTAGAMFILGDAHILAAHINGNHADTVGAIRSANMFMDDSTVINNYSIDMIGGIQTSGGVIEKTLFGNNRSTDSVAGALGVRGNVTVDSCVFTENKSLTTGAAIRYDGTGLTPGTLTVINTFFRDNETLDGTYAVIATRLGDTRITNVTMADDDGNEVAISQENGNLIALNTLITGFDTGLQAPTPATATEDYNLYYNNVTDFAGLIANGFNSIFGQDPLLPLYDFDALQDTSPAIDAGNDGVCPDYDRRMTPRPIDGDANGTAICDIGSYEHQLETLAVGFVSAETQAQSNLAAIGMALFALIGTTFLLITTRPQR